MTTRALRPADRFVAKNRKARHNYFIDDTVEAGIMLTGTEVKSLRAGRGNISEAYASETKGEIFLVNAHIPEYAAAVHAKHGPRRPRKLLLRRREIDRLVGAVQREGVTLVPLDIYFNPRGIAKLTLGIARGKRQYDKRAAAKDRDWKREKARVLKDRD